MSMESIYEYGSRVGVWRLARLFRQYQVPVTVFAVGMALEGGIEGVKRTGAQLPANNPGYHRGEGDGPGRIADERKATQRPLKAFQRRNSVGAGRAQLSRREGAFTKGQEE